MFEWMMHMGFKFISEQFRLFVLTWGGYDSRVWRIGHGACIKGWTVWYKWWMEMYSASRKATIGTKHDVKVICFFLFVFPSGPQGDGMKMLRFSYGTACWCTNNIQSMLWYIISEVKYFAYFSKGHTKQTGFGDVCMWPGAHISWFVPVFSLFRPHFALTHPVLSINVCVQYLLGACSLLLATFQVSFIYSAIPMLCQYVSVRSIVPLNRTWK